MSPSQRDRRYARQRFEKWQARRDLRTQRRRRRLAWLRLVGGVLAVILVVGGVWWLTRSTGDDAATGAAPAATGGADETSAAEPTEPVDSPCPAPPPLPAEPQQLDAAPDPATAGDGRRVATLATSCGDLTVELFADEAPQAVASFAVLAKEGYFADSPCHRLTTEGIFVLQCGDPTGSGQGGPGYSFGPVENAPADDVYPTGTLAMARVAGDGSSMGSQFFVVYDTSTIPSDDAGGYTVFGRVTDGLDVVRGIAEAGVQGGSGDGPPVAGVSIEAVTLQ